MLQETGLFPPRGTPFPKLILLVEDDPANAQFFLHILAQEASFRVFWATNGRAAWHFAGGPQEWEQAGYPLEGEWVKEEGELRRWPRSHTAIHPIGKGAQS